MSSASAMGAEFALRIEGVSITYDGVPAVSDVSFTVRRGAITTLIGSNGAGKTTILKGITGLHRLSAGQIWCYENEITNRATDEIVRQGIAMVPEGRRLFPTMTVRENLVIGAYLRTEAAAVRADLDRVLTYFPALAERLSSKVAVLSGGQQQMVAIARALMASPRLLLLDEPSIGLAPAIVLRIMEIIKSISSSGMDVLLVEQNANLALKVSHYGYIIENGMIGTHGPSGRLLESDAVREAYLGI